MSSYIWQKAYQAVPLLILAKDRRKAVASTFALFVVAEGQPVPNDPQAAEHWQTIRNGMAIGADRMTDDEIDSYGEAVWGLYSVLEAERSNR